MSRGELDLIEFLIEHNATSPSRGIHITSIPPPLAKYLDDLVGLGIIVLRGDMLYVDLDSLSKVYPRILFLRYRRSIIARTCMITIFTFVLCFLILSRILMLNHNLALGISAFITLLPLCLFLFKVYTIFSTG